MSLRTLQAYFRVNFSTQRLTYLHIGKKCSFLSGQNPVGGGEETAIRFDSRFCESQPNLELNFMCTAGS